MTYNKPMCGDYGRGIPQCSMAWGPSGDYASINCVRVAGHRGAHMTYWTWLRIPDRFRHKRTRRMAGK